jgi:PRTRC genetic system protein A
MAGISKRRSEAVHACVLVARSPAPLPYGACEERLDFRFGLVPAEMFETLRAAAISACPNEWAVCVLCDLEGGDYRLVSPEVESVSQGHIRYRHPEVYSDLLFLDIHSHGTLPAFFSEVDNASDVHGIYIASVFGHCESSSSLTAVSRLVVDGLHFPLDWNPWVEG